MVFFSTSALLSVFSLASFVLAAPTSINPPKLTGCPLTNAKPNLAGLAMPAGKIVYVALGMGTQNYTCGSAGTFTTAGAVASLFDISCLVNTPVFNNIQNITFDAASTTRGAALLSKLGPILNRPPVKLGDHYFVPNPAVGGTGINPDFDFRDGVKKGDPTGFAVLKKSASVPSPAGSTNVDWLSLQDIAPGPIGGLLANNVLRVDTRSGQPPASCTPNATIAVPYAAKYFFFKE
ncbi:hypothetical protein FRC07_012999 [Ceratobasidium sp. 392]|nr:hypothetical protein FRC07_012999 [Ceratobasidium sp. 392]